MDLDATVDILRQLVAFETVSSRPNAQLVDWAAERLRSCGARVLVQHGDQPGKANLFATLGPDDRAGLMLSGHSDVVPVEGQAWSSDPFRLEQRGGRLYGRGAADMKGFIACVLEAAPRLARMRLRTPLHVALSYDEETDMGGMHRLAAHLASAPVRPAGCVIGEPTSMRLVAANKGSACYRVEVRGHSAHSSLRDQGVSAVETAAEIVAFANALQRRLRAGARHDGFEFPFTSVHVGRIEGGTAHNIIARDCAFLLEIRALPGTRSTDVLDEIRAYCDAALLPAMRAIAPECAIAFERVVDTPPLDDRGNAALARAVAPLCGDHGPGCVSFGTEAGILQEIGVPTVVCGPGDIRVAHRPDEYVETTQLDACGRFLAALAPRLEQGDLPLAG